MKIKSQQAVRLGVGVWVILGVILGVSCKTPPPPPPPPPPIPMEPPPLPVDDIPADAPPAIRAHLIKLREMRDQGRISQGDYESRKALLLQSR